MSINMHLSECDQQKPGSIIRCLLVDLDGTLFDTLEANTAAYRKAFQECEQFFDEKTYRDSFGLGYNELIQVMIPQASNDLCEKIKIKKRDLYPEFFPLVKPNLPLINFLERQKTSCRIVLVTTASSHNATNLLDFFGKKDLFEKCFFREDVEKSKPSPEIYFKAIKWLDTSTEYCIAFEDSSKGIEAATKAGLQVIQVL